jgi:superfamily II DNA or RNA helicase
VVIGTLDSVSGLKFESVLADGDFSGNALLIVDEVHNVGAPTYQRTLRAAFNWRLGLSATPARYFDEEGTQVICEYFGTTVFTYDMRRALEDGHLCPYRYFVYPAHLDDAEYDSYAFLTRRIVQIRGNESAELTYRTDNSIDGDSAEISQLLFRRARILKKCRSKLPALNRALDAHPLQRGLIYCADNDQLLDVVQALQGRQIVHLTYTANTPTHERRSALQALGSGHVAVIVAIDCLDEGIDVPNVEEAIIIASSSNKRQFIQRRGRILRTAPGKAAATLVDVVALPPASAGRECHRMLNGELARVKEMAELALNKYDALMAVKECAEPYGVMLTELLSGEGDG